MRFNDDTITAISTPPGEGGIGIVRISGKKSINIAGSIFRPKKDKDIRQIPTGTVTYGFIHNNETGEKIDEVLLIIMKAPGSYTREDVVEISCHAGMASVKKIMELVIKNGARLAEPGEFTKRAFLNGRIDLAQAEAVMDIISAKTDTALSTAVKQLEGGLSKRIKHIKKQLIGILAKIEASIDFPEHDIEEITAKEINHNLESMMHEIEVMIEAADMGRIIRDGLKTAIVGKPNVGKSSLMNAIIKENKAIVTDVPGTTRDIIEEYINIKGIMLKVMDTAGFRETEDIVEKLGVEKTRQILNQAELIIYVIDSSQPLSQEDELIIDIVKNKKVIVLINKTDLKNKIDIGQVQRKLPGRSIIKTSVKENIGIDLLENAIAEIIYSGEIKTQDTPLLTNLRHKEALENARESIIRAINTIKGSMPLDIISIDIKDGVEYLGEITGEIISEDIIERIFQDFCIGK